MLAPGVVSQAGAIGVRPHALAAIIGAIPRDCIYMPDGPCNVVRWGGGVTAIGGCCDRDGGCFRIPSRLAIHTVSDEPCGLSAVAGERSSRGRHPREVRGSARRGKCRLGLGLGLGLGVGLGLGLGLGLGALRIAVSTCPLFVWYIGTRTAL